MFDIKLDKIPWDKVLWIGGAAVAVYFAYQWYNASQATAAANANAADQTDAQLAQLLLQSPLSSGEQADSSADVTAPSVDTGNSELQALVANILDPTSSSSAATSTSTPATATSTSTPPATATVTASTDPGTLTTPTTVNTPQPIINQTNSGSSLKASGLLTTASAS
jgi:hypothetical protein